MFLTQPNMCRLWGRIRYGVRWDRAEQAELALKAMSLANVSSVDISLDPFCDDCTALREFWHRLSLPKVRESNPKLRVSAQIRNDGQPPQFVAHLSDGRKLVFKTSGFHIADLLMRFNRLIGNPEMGLRGEPQAQMKTNMELQDRGLEDELRELSKKKEPIDFLS